MNNLTPCVLYYFNGIWTPQRRPPLLADILEATGVPLISPYKKKEGQTKFTILRDRVITLNQNYDGQVKHGPVTHLKIPGSRFRKLRFNGTATNGVNMIYRLIVSDSSVVNHPEVEWAYQFDYTDM